MTPEEPPARLTEIGADVRVRVPREALVGYGLDESQLILLRIADNGHLRGQQCPGPGRPKQVPIELPQRLVPVLIQLLRADTDMEASRRLNMSPRTFSRRVAELLAYLGVKTRFQGGVEIALHGWKPL